MLLGSPPLTRGILSGDAGAGLSDRITPAYAGNTDIQCTGNPSQWDHPRLRGEYRFLEI